MTDFRVQVGFPMDSSLPKDVVTLNPHFNGPDPAALAAALKVNLTAAPPFSGHPFTVKVYDALKPPPSYPLAVEQVVGTTPNSQTPREIALCVSYYTTYNRPRFRGRLYLPGTWFGSAPALKPSTATMNSALGWVKAAFHDNLPASTAWVVFSPTERKSQGGVSDMWCDNEWDTVRSRGLVADNRVTMHF